MLYAKQKFSISHFVDSAIDFRGRIFDGSAGTGAHIARVIGTFAPIVEKVAPTVVTVFTTQSVSQTVLPSPLSDEALHEFFGEQLPQRQGKQTLEGLGSGVIVSADGYILTANHVVAKADEIMVGLGAELRK